ncbi:dienelactone hydrolase family protein [Amphiplicatus metriothermophilus]|uniref:Carboxymethylenebutenolidase n=1 Tax=Amphiplicatus metriothermophilus TaxID=1519374 RepID=A0A239PK09_9PROT|nr:dienelactone hydrolase family protein [Amphiplicatus metriothermophilus]MBB5517517.1 carboxymethylenebutenolidase [Amphiplicatus metriothermophilus]SNT68148.1 carboxymethylenebutenolidase [Amphiplicatus metriothermophilus]
MAAKIPQAIIDLYDAFTHGALDRRAFLERLAGLAGGAAAASALLPMLTNDYARAAIVPEDDPRLDIFTARFDVDVVDLIEPEELVADGAPNAGVVPTRHLPFVTAYGARPKNAPRRPAVIVIHENRGLNPHIKDVARRIALEGFHAYAVDMLSPFGGTPDDEDRARAMIGKLDRDKTVAKLAEIAGRVERDKAHGGKVGAVGFCWGGGMVNALAAAQPALDAGVAYYGRPASAEEAARIKAALLLHYAGEDARINAGVPDYEAALKAAGVDYRLYMYEGAQHAFNNDTNAARYDRAAADLAWSRTIAFLKERLG